MIGATLLVTFATGSLLDGKGWAPAGRQGKTAEPDYKAIVSKLSTIAPEGWALAPAAVVSKAEGGLRQLRAAYNSAPDYTQISRSVLAAANTDSLSALTDGVRNKAEDGIRLVRAAYR